MADEPQAPAVDTQPSRAEEGITELSSKVKQESEARVAAEAKATAAEKRVQLAEGYADMVSTYPAAKEFKADIEAKVMAGLTPEDATLAVLGKAGKLGNTVPPAPPQNPAGGSASTAMPQGSEKPVSEMSQEERRAKLSEEIVWT